MFSFLRAPLPPRTYRAESNPIIYEDGASSLEFREAGSDYLLRNVHPPFNPDSPSIMVPPFHYHIKQAEHFRIVSGTCHLFKDSEKEPWITLSSTSPETPKTAVIPKKIYHTINNASTTEPLVLDVNLTPEEYDNEQRFFRNFFGYLDDCRKAGQQPSLIQLLVFLDSSDTPLGLTMPTKWLGIVASRLFMVVISWWGRWVLGYKSSYEEYFIDKKHS